MTIKLSLFELVSAPRYINDKEMILSLLKSKGAPIINTVLLDVDPNWFISEYYEDCCTRDRVYTFSKRPS